MSLPDIRFPGWARARTLDERVILFRAQRAGMRQTVQPHKTATRRWDHWCSQPPFNDPDLFAQRLAASGVSEDEFLDALADQADATWGDDAIPPWVMQLVNSFSLVGGQSCVDFASCTSPGGSQLSNLLWCVEPLVSNALRNLQAGLADIVPIHGDMPFDSEAIYKIFVPNLFVELDRMLIRCLVLELNVARIQGSLEGSSGTERFQDFLSRLRESDTKLRFLRTYPVLARQLTTRINAWVSSSLTFLSHLCEDWNEITSAFSQHTALGCLIEANGRVGDSHRGGRSVIIARFSSGIRVVYKPRSVAADLHFNHLLDWVNRRLRRGQFRILTILDRGDHGWVEFVAAKDCASKDEIDRFYQRQGGYLALLYAMGGTDLHCDNLVAAGEDPVLLDLEALFHPAVERGDSEAVGEFAGRVVSSSVLRTGFVPLRVWPSGKSDGIDRSGLAAPEGQITPFGVLQLELSGTDEMHIVRKPKLIPESMHRPRLRGREIDVLDHVESVASGFRRVYELMLHYRHDLLARDGPLARFQNDEVRVILRATQKYSSLLSESFHPDVLRDAIDRDLLFDLLWVDVARRPHLSRVVQSEINDLRNGDIPLFTTRATSCHIYTSSGQEIADFFPESGYASVCRRVQQMSSHDLETQLWFLRASLATLDRRRVSTVARTHSPTPLQATIDHDRLLAGACAVGDRLEALAVQQGSEAAWIGLTMTQRHSWSIKPLDSDLYDGISGVVLFLAHLGAITEDDRYTKLAQAGLSTVRRRMRHGLRPGTPIGAFSGYGGIIYTLTHLAVLWHWPELIEEAFAIAAGLQPLIDLDDQYDIIGGAAGCMASLFSIYRSVPRDIAMTMALRCGDRLVETAKTTAKGMGWVNARLAQRPLTGFAHGAAGIAWALMEFAELTGIDRFNAAAVAACNYERSLFDPLERNWPDLRELESLRTDRHTRTPRFMTAWCHGAPGVGLSRLSMLRHIDDAEIHAEINIALEKTVESGFGGNHSLCHGDLGNLEVIAHASRILDVSAMGSPGPADSSRHRPHHRKRRLGMWGTAGGGVTRPDDGIGGHWLWAPKARRTGRSAVRAHACSPAESS